MTQLFDRADARVWEYHQHEASNHAIAIAPHGGEIEPYTATQAFDCSETHDACSAWVFCANVEEGSAFDRYHITSPRIRIDEHQALAEIARDIFAYAVSFHGFSCDATDIYLGGQLDRQYRERIASEIHADTGFDVLVAMPGDGLYSHYGGHTHQNIVNRLGEYGGIQIEQTKRVRNNAHDDVADAVARALEDIDDDVLALETG